MRRVVAYFLLAVAVLSGLIWGLQRSGAKILYCDKEVPLDQLAFFDSSKSRQVKWPMNLSAESQSYLYVAADRNAIVIHIISMEKVKTVSLFGRVSMLLMISGTKTVDIPLVPVMTGAFVVAIILFALPRLRNARRRRLGRCVVCSYSLVGNTSGVCSECGAAIDSSALRAVGG